MKKRMFGCLAAVAVVAFAVACRPPVVYQQDYQKYDRVIVQVDTIFHITMADLYDSLYHCYDFEGGGILSPDKLAPILDSLLIDTLTGLSAYDIRLEDDYVEHRMYRKRYEKLLRSRYLDYRIFDYVQADSAEIAEFYFSRADLHQVPEQVLLWQILVTPHGLRDGPDSNLYVGMTDEALGRAIRDYVHEIRDLIDSAEQFEEVARAYSHELTVAQTGGRVGWTPRGYYLDPFDSIAFSAQSGEISDPYQDIDGWHILYLEQFQSEGIPSLDSNQYQLAKQNLMTTKGNEINAHLRDSIFSLPLEIVYNEELLDTNLHLVEPGVWAAVFNATDTVEFYDLRGLEERFRLDHGIDNTTVEMKRQMIQSLTSQVLLTQTARGARIDTLPEVMEIEAELRHRHSKSVAKRLLRDPLWTPSDSMIAAYYEAHPDEFAPEFPFVLQQMVVSDSGLGLFLQDQALSGQDFLELAYQHHTADGDNPMTRIDLGPVVESDVLPAVWKQALLTSAGGVSEPTKTEFGYHLVRVIERTDFHDLGRATPDIRKTLTNEHIRSLKDRIREKLYVRYKVSFPNELLQIHLRPKNMRLVPLHGPQ